MTNWKSQNHATTTVARNKNGDIRYIKCRSEYFEEDLDADDHADDKYAEGASAKFKFNVVGGDLAVLDSVKDISDDAESGYETSLDFLRAVPIAERAVENVPGIEAVQDTREHIFDALERGEESIDE